MGLFWKYALEKKTVKRSLKVALIVGTILGMINHFDMFVTGDYQTKRIMQMIVTYIVPYCVATFGAAMQAKQTELERLEAGKKRKKKRY